MELVENIRDKQNLMLPVMVFIDKLCREHNLRYSLAYGTLIGAIRHKGFIPWDDDVDIIMPADDYDKFISICKSQLGAKYLMQNKDNSDDFTQNFTKIRKKNTTFIHSENEKRYKYHKGIFVDVFPGYRVPKNKLLRKLQYILCAFNLLYAREFSKSVGVKGMIEKILLTRSHIFRIKAYSFTDKIIKKISSSSTKTIGWVFPNTIEWAKKIYPTDMFENMERISFHNEEFMAVNDTDRILRMDYGDYWKLPPESERVLKHHPIIVSLTENLD